jgi:hypothetical protein
MAVQGTPLIRLGAKDLLSLQMGARLSEQAKELAAQKGPAAAEAFITGAAAVNPQALADPTVFRTYDAIRDEAVFNQAVSALVESVIDGALTIPGVHAAFGGSLRPGGLEVEVTGTGPERGVHAVDSTRVLIAACYASNIRGLAERGTAAVTRMRASRANQLLLVTNLLREQSSTTLLQGLGIADRGGVVYGWKPETGADRITRTMAELVKRPWSPGRDTE